MASNPPGSRPAIRWWPAALIVAALAAFWFWVWNFHPGQRQDKNLSTLVSLLVGGLLLFLWVLLLSRLRWRIRLTLLGGVVVLGGFLGLTLRVHGVTGDFLPILAWRWNKPAALQPLSVKALPPPVSRVSVSFPQFLGPQRDGILPGPRLARDWEQRPPQELWRQPVGAGWSGFAVENNYAATMEQVEGQELATCRELLSGRLLWSHADQARYATVIAGEGPRTVPSIRSNRVYTVGATGLLNCLDLTTGALVWSRNILRDAGAQEPDWGLSGSALLNGNEVIVCAGGRDGQSLAAYDAETGERLWAGGNARAHYSSPVSATLGGERQILIFNAEGVSSHDSQSGQVLWEYGWRGGHPHIAAPVALFGDRVLISSGYGTGSELIQVAHASPGQWTINRLWKSNRLKSKFANLICFRDHIYGLDDGILVCLDLNTGELIWKEGRYGHGQLLLVGEVLLVMAESGEVVLVEATPIAPRELTRFRALEGKTWNPPALAGPYLLVRNDHEAACFKLPVLN